VTMRVPPKRVPPRSAMWLLRQFGPRYGRESLAGDLYEEYQLNRTRAWYWRQVVVAIWVGRITGVRLLIQKVGLLLSRTTLSVPLRIATEAAAIIGAVALSQQFRQACALAAMSHVASVAMVIGAIGLSISVGLYLSLCLSPRARRASQARRSPSLLKRLMAVFTVTALSAGTLTWASGNSHMSQQCAFQGSSATVFASNANHRHSYGK
jgi:hypothetical protein